MIEQELIKTKNTERTKEPSTLKLHWAHKLTDLVGTEVDMEPIGLSVR